MPLKSTVVDVRQAPAITSSRPVAVGVELEAQLRVELEPARDVRDARRDDEAQRLLLAPERLAEREARLPEREVERSGLEGPAAVLGLPGLEQRERVECVLRPRNGSLPSSAWNASLRARVVVDLLAAALVAVAVQHDDRAAQREPARDLAARAARGR